MGKLAGRTAIVTGAGGGIGSAIAKLLSREEARVACLDIDGEQVSRTVVEMKQSDHQAIACVCDVADADAVDAAVATVSEAFGSIHILVNCAATITPMGPIVELAEEDWDHALGVNLKSVFLLCKRVIPEIARAGGGSIVNLASNFGHVGLAGRAAYCASKGGVISFTRCLALDHARDNIRVNSISPGSVETPRGAKQYGSIERMREIRGPLHPIGRIGKPEEVAAAALFLVCDDAAFMTGADIVVDGGYIAR